MLIASPKPEDTRGERVAFYGDSYTLGTGASDVQNRWSLAPVGDGARRGFLSALFGLHPYTYLRWIPADQAIGDRCP